MTRINAVVFSLVMACTSTGKDPIAVTGANDVGVVALEIDRYADGLGSVFELHGIDASGADVGVVRLRIGAISDLHDLLGGGNVGSEITLSVRDFESRSVTYEIHELRQLAPQDDQVRSFLTIPEIVKALADVHLQFDVPTGSPSDIALTTQSCPVNYMLTSPTANQCCFSNYNGQWSTHANGTYMGSVVSRTRNPTGLPCRASDGSTTCSGGSCYFGPNGFARASITAATLQNPYPKVLKNQTYYCYGTFGPSALNPPPQFGSVTGTFPRGYGCCVNGTGPCPDATSCTNCGGGGASSRGAWDY